MINSKIDQENEEMCCARLSCGWFVDNWRFGVFWCVAFVSAFVCVCSLFWLFCFPCICSKSLPRGNQVDGLPRASLSVRHLIESIFPFFCFYQDSFGRLFDQIGSIGC